MKIRKRFLTIFNRTPKPYRALNSISKVSTLAGKLKYTGPRSYRAIIAQIHDDAEKENISLSYDFIKRVIGLFFNRLLVHMAKGDYLKIDGLGEFGMTPREKKRRQVSDEARAKNNYFTRLRLIKKIEQRNAAKNKMEYINVRRSKIGLKPLTYDIYIRITKKRKPRKPKCNPINLFTFDILENKEKES